MFKRRLFRILTLIGLATLGLLGGLVALATYASERRHDVALPAITADRSPEGVARGAAIFHTTCEACHRAPTGERASGAPIHDAPEWLGTLHSGNLTSDRSAGIGALSDALAARTIRFGVNRDGHWVPMPAYAMSDADLAAVLGFLRSDDPLFRPDPRPAPRTRLSVAGRSVLFLAGVFTPPLRPASIAAPPKAPSVDYGRYLAEGVYQCGDCHSPSFDSAKGQGPDAFAGGIELRSGSGETIYSPNISRDTAAGIGRWSRDEFALAVRSGVRPDGSALGYPMPHFRGADDVEVDALWAFLRSFPAQTTPVQGRRPALAEGRVAAGAPTTNLTARQTSEPKQTFERLGCVACHGQGAPFQAKLAQASGKPVADVARWIRNPELYRPGTAMPTFASVLDEPAALALATWIQQGAR